MRTNPLKSIISLPFMAVKRTKQRQLRLLKFQTCTSENSQTSYEHFMRPSLSESRVWNVWKSWVSQRSCRVDSEDEEDEEGFWVIFIAIKLLEIDLQFIINYQDGNPQGDFRQQFAMNPKYPPGNARPPIPGQQKPKTTPQNPIAISNKQIYRQQPAYNSIYPPSSQQYHKTPLPQPQIITYPSQTPKNRPSTFLPHLHIHLFFTKPTALPPVSPESSLFQASLKISQKDLQPLKIIKQFFRNVDLGLGRLEVLDRARREFRGLGLGLEEEELRGFVGEFWWGGFGVDVVGGFLRNRGIDYREDVGRETIVFCEKGAVEDYLHYGQCIYIMAYQKLVPIGSTIYNPLIFLAPTKQGHPLLLATSLTKSLTSKNLLQLLQTFYGCMQGFISNTIALFLMGQDEGGEVQGEFRRAVDGFGERYGWEIGVRVESGVGAGIGGEVEAEEERKRLWKELNQEIGEEIERVKKEIKSEMDASTLKQLTLTLTLLKPSPTHSKTLSKYHPKSPATPTAQSPHPKSYSFIGLVSKISQLQSLRNRMQTMVKLYPPQLLSFTQLVIRTRVLGREMRKVCREGDCGGEWRFLYREYWDDGMYRLYRSLSTKIFSMLQKSYLQALTLTPHQLSPTQLTITESTHPHSHLTSTHTYTLTYQLQHEYWICNCYKLQETGLPCRHLIAVVLHFKGDIGYYVCGRWLAMKGEVEAS